MTKRGGGEGGGPPVTNRVELTVGGCEVVVESPEPLAAVVRTAKGLLAAVTEVPVSRQGVPGTIGFTVSEAQAGGLMPAELQLPDRIVWDEPGN